MRKTKTDLCCKCGDEIPEYAYAQAVKTDIKTGLMPQDYPCRKQPRTGVTWVQSLLCAKCRTSDDETDEEIDDVVRRSGEYPYDSFTGMYLMKYGKIPYENAVRHNTFAPCDGCGRPLKGSANRNRHVCSESCNQRAKRGSLLAERKCDHCGDDYIPTRSDSRFCRATCRVAAHREKR